MSVIVSYCLSVKEVMKMKVSKKVLTFLLCILLSLVMVGTSACSGGGNDSEGDGAGGTLLIGTGEFNGIFNYIFSASAYDSHIGELVQAMIYDVGPGGELVDGVCEYQVPEIKTDENGDEYSVYTFKVKEGIEFTDGTPLTIDD